MRAFQFLWLMWCVALTASCASSMRPTADVRAEAQATATPVLRVMSYNIRCGSCERVDDVNHWSQRKFRVARLIREARADLIGLQEAEKFQVDDLVTLLADFDWVGVGRDDGYLKGEMNAVLVRRSAFSIESQQTLWLSETPYKMSLGWDAMFKRTLTLLRLKDRQRGRELYFLNTHFDHHGVHARSQSAQLIVQTVLSLPDRLPVLLTGDLNERPDSVSYRTLTEVLRDAERVSQQTPVGGDISFNGFGRDIQSGNKIDFVFVGQGISVRSHSLITTLEDGYYPSDHYPVLAEVTSD